MLARVRVTDSDIAKALLAAVAGAVLPLAYAPFGWFWLAPVSYAVLFLSWRGSRPRSAFWSGFAFGASSFLCGLYWVYISIHGYGQAPVWLAVVLTGALVATLALFVASAGWLAARWFETSGPLAWWGSLPALWVLLEWCRGWFLSGFGWLSAGYSQTDSWLMGYAPVLGVYGMSWIVLVSAGALVSIVLGTRRTRLSAAVLIAVLWVCGRLLDGHGWTSPRGKALTVALVQGAVSQDLKWLPEEKDKTLDLYARLTRASAGSDLIVWPEAAIPVLYQQVPDYLAGIRAWAERHGSTVLLGILRRDRSGEGFQNTLVALTNPPLFYVKRHLVPFGEYFPVPAFVRRWMRLQSLPYTDAERGSANQPPLPIAGERIAVTICYEDVFGAEQLGSFPEATLLVNVSNDAWFGDSIAPHQHLQIATVRAAETGRYMLRSTNTGITAIIDPRGRVVGRAPQFEPYVLKGSVQGFTGATPYVRWGNLPVVLGIGLVLGLSRLLRSSRYGAARKLRA
jgi:apolipoprotein N-acyltransferase